MITPANADSKHAQQIILKITVQSVSDQKLTHHNSSQFKVKTEEQVRNGACQNGSAWYSSPVAAQPELAAPSVSSGGVLAALPPLIPSHASQVLANGTSA